MKILILAATRPEIYMERFSGCEMLITGVGMVNTAVSLTQQLSRNDYDLVVNMGVAGSFITNLKIGDVVEVIEDTYSELGFEDREGLSFFAEFELNTTFTNKSRTTLSKAKSITVNTVHGDEKSIAKIVRHFNPDIENMEGAAVFQVCEKFGVDCLQIRSISNKVEERNKANWNLPLAIQNLNKEVEKIIEEL